MFFSIFFTVTLKRNIVYNQQHGKVAPEMAEAAKASASNYVHVLFAEYVAPALLAVFYSPLSTVKKMFSE